ncbi:sporulation protein YunB [Sporosarcina sp. YIM B06819]|uniref:sporulation protein YunB n=1 Tax=Sporosarcina sp. YIM B06819 TaxID=3081769 RepID=UPI00298BEE63|nr:sporulation protein YunB [Sporosarcina sp. YIM B06819]
MRFHVQSTRRSRKKKRKWLPLLIPAFLIAIALFLYIINMRLTPIYVQYAEVQTRIIAAHVINKALTSRDFKLPSVEEMFPAGTNGSTGVITINAEAASRAVGDIHALVATHLKQAEAGNFDMLPMQNNIEYDPQAMESQKGIVFFVPIGQALNIPLLGNFGPKIPIRFHVIGEVHTDIEPTIKEFGINSASVEVNVVVTVNVQIIVPLATQESVVEQRILIAMGIIPGTVPPVFSNGGGAAPNIEIPVQLPKQ